MKAVLAAGILALALHPIGGRSAVPQGIGPAPDDLIPLLQAVERPGAPADHYRRLFLHLRRLIARETIEISSAAVDLTRRFFNDRPGSDPRIHYARGVAAKLAGDYASAAAHFESALRRGPLGLDVFEESIPYFRSKAELLRAIDILRQRLAEDADPGLLHQGLGYLHFWLDQYELSERHYAEAWRRMSASGRDADEAGCLYHQAYLFMYLNQYDRAREAIGRSLSAARRTGNRAAEIQGLELLGFIHIEQGDYRGALDLCVDALRRARALGDPDLEAMCLRTVGVARMETGDLAAADESLGHAADWYRRVGEDRRLGVVLYWQSLLYKQQGDLSRALLAARRGLEISQREGFRTAEAFHLSAIGDFYFALGHHDKALLYNKKALLISQSHIGKWSREECLNSIGSVYMETARYREALEYFKLALNYVRQIAHTREEARCLYNIGLACLELGDDDRAEDYFQRGRAEAESSGKKTVLGLCLVRLGDLARRRGDEAAAEDRYLSAAILGDETGQPAIRWQAAAGRGALAADRGRIAEAVEHYRSAVAVIEDQRSLIVEREHSAGFFQSKLGVYERLIDLYFELHSRHPEAGHDRSCFEFAERARSRAFLDDLRAARIDPRTWPGPESRREILALSRTVSRLLTELSRPDLGRAERETLWASLEETEEGLQAAVEAVRLERPELVRLMRCEPSGLDEIRRLAIGPGTALVELFAGEDRVFVFFVSAERFAVHRLSGDDARAIRALARNYAQLLTSSRLTSMDCAAAGRRLYDRLIRPGLDVIGPGTRRLVVVPDREFSFVPFETLNAGTAGPAVRSPDYLARSYAITYSPSASSLVNILARAEPSPRPKDLLAIGDPILRPAPEPASAPEWDNPLEEYYREKRFELTPLPFTRREIKRLARFVRPDRRDVLLGRSATEDALGGLRLDDYRILHFATHSLVDERVSHRSALVLTQDSDPAEDGFLQVREIYLRELQADLVVLSACQTARGKLEKGEGVQGLPRAFFCAGARAVLVSLWPVGDRSTARFMEKFYARLAAGWSLEESLRRTKLDLARRAKPADWAGFVLLGDGERRLELPRPSLPQRIISRIF